MLKSGLLLLPPPEGVGICSAGISSAE